jgi:GWxTD domain-containing protein
VEGRTVKTVCTVVLFLASAAAALAQPAKYKDWAKSPEAYFLTPAERAEWSKVSTDADAEKFIADYWAKRGGQKFKDEIVRRMSAADEQFRSPRQKGSQSVRGRILIVLGGPSRVTTNRALLGSEGAPPPATGSTFGQEPFVQTWFYEKDRFDSSWGIGDLQVRILVDPTRGIDELQGASPVEKAIAKVAEKTIVARPASAAGAPPAAASATSAAPAAAPPPPAALPAAVRSALEALAKEPKDSHSSGFWSGSFRSAGGDPFVAVEMVLPADRVPAGGVKFGGLVTAESGQEAAAYWEDAALSEVKSGTRTDKVVEHVISLPPGSYRAAFGIFPADGSPALVSATAALKLEPKSESFEVSPLILANAVTPLSKRPGPTDPFVFGVEKPVHVAPKASGQFAKDESLWYFYTVTNPGLPAVAATTAPATASSTPSAATTPAASAASPKPRVMTRIGVLRNGQPAFAPFTGTAELQLLSPGHYAAGSEIPLATFEPGFYTFTMNIRDLNAPRESVAFKGTDLKADFVVLKPDGSLPEKPTPTPSAKTKASPKKN